MINLVSVKDTELNVCSGVNLITGNIQQMSDASSAIGGALAKQKNNDVVIVSSDYADGKDYRGVPVLIWFRPERWLHTVNMRDLAKRVKALADFGSQVFVFTNDYLLMSWLSTEWEFSDTKTEFKFFNFYTDGDVLCVEDVMSSAYFSHSAVSKAYSELFDFKLEKAMGGLGK